MDKRYQIFVSSTYEDLREERQKVIQSLLEFDCIPAGMEFFPAADESQWKLIKRVIEDCDYYIVIVGGRYGSVSPKGISYTQQEYEYAVEIGKPVCAFLHADPGKIAAEKVELEKQSRRKLDEFRELCKKKMCKYWESADQLGGLMIGSLNQLTKTRPAVGWVRADQVPDESAIKDILRLKNKIEELTAELNRIRMEPPKGIQDFAQGKDRFDLCYSYSMGKADEIFPPTYSSSCTLTWDEIFASIAPHMVDAAGEDYIRAELSERIRTNELPILEKKSPYDKFKDFSVSDDDFQTVKIQLRSLGLIKQSTRQRSLKDKETYWFLTPYGDDVMVKLRAIKKSRRQVAHRSR